VHREIRANRPAFGTAVDEALRNGLPLMFASLMIGMLITGHVGGASGVTVGVIIMVLGFLATAVISKRIYTANLELLRQMRRDSIEQLFAHLQDGTDDVLSTQKGESLLAAAFMAFDIDKSGRICGRELDALLVCLMPLAGRQDRRKFCADLGITASIGVDRAEFARVVPEAQKMHKATGAPGRQNTSFAWMRSLTRSKSGFPTAVAPVLTDENGT